MEINESLAIWTLLYIHNTLRRGPVKVDKSYYTASSTIMFMGGKH